MKKILFGAILFTSIQTSIFAALPPLWQNVQELKIILNDKRLGDFLNSGDVIQSVKKTDDGWIIVTNHKRLNVKVQYENSQNPGPVQFRISFQEG